MKKIAINRCFGGFNLSPKFYIKYAEALGKKAYFFTGIEHAVSATPEECEGTLFWNIYTVPNPQDYLKYPDGKSWQELTSEEKGVHNKIYKEISIYAGEIPRDDPLLIKILEELGDDASGNCGEVKIVEIPDDVDWVIDEYDGLETVEERHRSWR